MAYGGDMATLKKETAPDELELVRAFVNTADLEDDEEELDSPAAFKAWLLEVGLLGRGADVVEPDLRRAIDVREALRALLVANAGGALDPRAPVTLDQAARRAGLALRFAPGGTSRLEPAAAGVDGAIGQILARVAEAMSDGSWARLKACRRETCAWAFYDHTKNHSGVWCEMAVCGNRAKAEAYRRRQAEA
jgi:predicted RNA-binding Zn ribbon-like protein